jgi:hypothetical protein
MTMAFALLALVVLGVVLLVRRARRRRAGRGPDPLHVPTLDVVTIGMQGCGKTILLAGMYRSMQTPSNRDFHLRAPYDQVIELGSWFHDVAAPEQQWPAGTRKSEMREFRFDVVTRTAAAAETVLRLNYLEYAGELLTERQEPGATAQRALFDAVAKADALIGIVDGLRVRQAYYGDGRGAALLQRCLDTMVGTMFESTSPITFIVTKWDLLDDLHPDQDVRLGIVRTMLMASPGFRDLVREHSARRVIRLIPVSAVGHDFAYLDGSGTVRKKPGGTLQPLNVDLPLATVVPDVLHQIELSLDASTRQAIMTEARRHTDVGPLEALATLGTFIVRTTGRTLGADAVGLLAEAGLALLDRSPRPDHRAGQRADRLATAETRADQIILARRKVIRALHHRVGVLEARFPSSVLGDGGVS